MMAHPPIDPREYKARTEAIQRELDEKKARLAQLEEEMELFFHNRLPFTWAA